jgi:ClpP class serine protease
VQPEKADAALAQLLQREDELPARYQKLAGLMQQDLAALDDQSLDHIARRMDDIRRRLAQGRTGKIVQGVENGVIDSLDKLIKQAEDQMQQQQSQSSQAPQGQQQGTPMQDSQIADLKAPGSVERRDIGRGTGWGNVPERDREKALQEIGREFPSHYREVIEEYFRRLAAEESAEQP